jgi:meiotic recombination protein SPO11
MKQSVVDRYVDDLACTFGISRSQLNVVRTVCSSMPARPDIDAQTAAPKGLVAGNFQIRHEDGYYVDAMKSTEV